MVEEIHLNGNRCAAPMMEVRDGVLQKSVRVQAELEWRDDHWVFTNFDYFYPDDPKIKPFDLRSLLTAGEEENRKVERDQK